MKDGRHWQWQPIACLPACSHQITGRLVVRSGLEILNKLCLRSTVLAWIQVREMLVLALSWLCVFKMYCILRRPSSCPHCELEACDLLTYLFTSQTLGLESIMFTSMSGFPDLPKLLFRSPLKTKSFRNTSKDQLPFINSKFSYATTSSPASQFII